MSSSSSRAVLRSAGLSLISGADVTVSPRPDKPTLELRSRSTTDSALPINIYAEADSSPAASQKLRQPTGLGLMPSYSAPRLRPSSAKLEPQPTVARNTRALKRHTTLDSKVRRLLESPEPGYCEEVPHPAIKDLADFQAVSLCGRVTEKEDRYQPYFSGKRMDFSKLGQFDELPHNIGVHCQRGKKDDSPNQDDFFVLQTNEWLFCGVADGHGENGHKVSHFVQEQLPQAILQRLKLGHFANWRTSVVGAVDEVQTKLQKQIPDEASESGSTASMTFLSKDESGAWKFQSAFIGDSVIVYARRPRDALTFQVELVTSTHRPDRQDEFQRISRSNGEVIPADDPALPSRLRVPGGDMAMSRALGDLEAQQYGMCCEPEFPTECQLKEEDEHLIILCSDGVWDMVNPREAVNIAAKFEAQRAAERLAAKAQSRWQEESDTHIDDITVIVIRTGSEAKQRGDYAENFGGSRPASFR